MLVPEEETGSCEEPVEAAVIDYGEGRPRDHRNSTTEECEEVGWAAAADNLAGCGVPCPALRR